MSTNPTILLAHGSYHEATIYNSFLQSLRSHGFETYCPQLPTASRNLLVADPSNPSFDQAAPAQGLPPHSADASLLNSHLESLVEEQGKHVLILAHSSGGWSATESALPALLRVNRARDGKKGGVMGIFYLAAFLILKGESVNSTFAAAPAPASPDDAFFALNETGTLTVPNQPRRFFFHDVPEADVQSYIDKLTACTLLTSPLTNDIYGQVEAAYMLCESDRVLPLVYQQGMVKGAEKSGGKRFEVFKCKGGHEAFLSCESEVVDAVEKFVQRLG